MAHETTSSPTEALLSDAEEAAGKMHIRSATLNLDRRFDVEHEVDGGGMGRNPLMSRKKGRELRAAFGKLLATKPTKMPPVKKDDGTGSVMSMALQRRRQREKRKHEVEVSPLGEDPVHDAREKKLLRLATKGVVQILNNVSRIHKQRQVDNREAVAAKLPVAPEPDLKGSSEEVEEVVEGQEWDVLQESFLDRSPILTSEEERSGTETSDDTDSQEAS